MQKKYIALIVCALLAVGGYGTAFLLGEEHELYGSLNFAGVIGIFGFGIAIAIVGIAWNIKDRD